MDLNKNKNYEFVINMVTDVVSEVDNLHCVTAVGVVLWQYLHSVVSNLVIGDIVYFLVFCNNIKQWGNAAYIFVFLLYRTGLSVFCWRQCYANFLYCAVSI